jgi:Cytochrome c oxidase assembly protein CtaG/Cox11
MNRCGLLTTKPTLKDKMNLFLLFAVVLFPFLTAHNLESAEPALSVRQPASVAHAYLRAVYARDFAEAYRYVSGEDQRARNLNQYLRQRGPFNGFALDVARMLAAMVEVKTTQTQTVSNRVLLTVHYTAPDPEKLSALLRHWNGYQLNSLSPTERKQIIEAIESKRRDGSIEMIAGEEKLTLMKEGDEWRILLDWAAGVTISIHTIVAEPAAAAAVDVRFSPKQVAAQPGEVFEIILKVKNLSAQPITTRIGHLVEPKELADYFEIVQCGFLLPVSLQPGVEQEYSATYFLRGSLPEGVRKLSLNYDFRLDQAK